jgi:hypothetical protein
MSAQVSGEGYEITIIRKTQIKVKRRYHVTLGKMMTKKKAKKKKVTNTGMDMKK